MLGSRPAIAALVAAVAIVVGSYLGAQYLRVWRPRHRGRQTAHRPERPPAGPPGLRSVPVGASD